MHLQDDVGRAVGRRQEKPMGRAEAQRRTAFLRRGGDNHVPHFEADHCLHVGSQASFSEKDKARKVSS
jgi:hypothetical protein